MEKKKKNWKNGQGLPYDAPVTLVAGKLIRQTDVDWARDTDENKKPFLKKFKSIL